MYLVGLGVIVHVVVLFSIFDIYFKSPLSHGMTPFSIPLSPPASRVVLFVADGLRADKLFEIDTNGETNAPFLREVVTEIGAWGVSHTRVPTESRPGHVALAAGIFEDVSAITKGWKENPVDFDSVFNESRYTWAWGSPDILPMFAKGPQGDHVFIDTYKAEEEDFAKANPSHLDTWVFEKFEAFLSHAKLNHSLSEMLTKDKVIFFLHMLGLDTSGHAYKPNSKEYLTNIQVVDRGVEKCMQLIEDFYGSDGKTTYIFTSDHGMTDWGSHGASDPEETHTPLIAWGAGIRGPLGEGKDNYHDGLSEGWKLTQYKRVDVTQVDIAPLIAAVLGIPFPVNSVGILPVEYLGTDWPYKALSLLTNTRQIVAQFQLKMRRKQETTIPFLFWPYRDLSSSRQAELMSMIDTLLKQNRYRDAIQVGLKLSELALNGIAYYQKYDRFALSMSMFLGFTGWMSYLVTLILKDFTSVGHSSLESSTAQSNDSLSQVKIIIAYGFLSGVISFLLQIQDSPLMYYMYFLMPVFLWALVTLRWDIYHKAKAYVERKNCIFQFLGLALISVIALELLVMSFFRRESLCVGLWAVAVWPFFTSLKSSNKALCCLWLLASLVMSSFPLMPVVGRDSNYSLVVLAGWLSVLIVAFCARRPETGLILSSRLVKKEPQQVVFITVFQTILLVIATIIVRSTSNSIAEKEGLPILSQIMSWLILVLTFISPLFGSVYLLTRSLNVVTALLAPYILLSISHESLFCLFLCVLMFLWLCIEYSLSGNYIKLQDVTFLPGPSHAQRKFTGSHNLGISDLRKAYFFIFFILLAFFGTGNIASINSFEPSSVFCFLTVFNPFVMGFLILLKIVIPFLMVSCTFRAILVVQKASPKALFLLILLMSDFVGLHFFFLVHDSGSWLEIGTSISHYVINMTVIIFIILLYGLAYVLTSCSLTLVSFTRKRHVL